MQLCHVRKLDFGTYIHVNAGARLNRMVGVLIYELVRLTGSVEGDCIGQVQVSKGGKIDMLDQGKRSSKYWATEVQMRLMDEQAKAWQQDRFAVDCWNLLTMESKRE